MSKTTTPGTVTPRNSAFFKRAKTLSKKTIRTHYANDFSVLNPTIWANEAILQLQPNFVIGQFVNRDFDPIAHLFGDVVNAYVPGSFNMTRKNALCDPIVIQDTAGSVVQASLNQWPQVSFQICDGGENRSALDLVNVLLPPAVQTLARGIDRILSSQVNQFLGNSGGHLGTTDPNVIRNSILQTREVMNRNNVPTNNRAMILTPGTETQALQLDTIVTADKTGDGGNALTNALLGKKYGFDFLMAQDAPEVNNGQVTLTGITTATSVNAGATTFSMSSATGVTVGNWLSIAGDDKANQIVALAGVNATLRYSIKSNVASGAAVTIVKPGVVNNSAGYAGTAGRLVGWSKEIAFDGMPGSMPQNGQIVSFGADTTNIYTIIGVRIIDSVAGTGTITLDVPLVSSVADNTLINLGPAGRYNFALVPNSVTLINRPLAAPRPETGVAAKTVNDLVNKLGLRVTIVYDGIQQAHICTLDTLIGVGVLNRNLGAVMYA